MPFELTSTTFLFNLPHKASQFDVAQEFPKKNQP